MMEPTSSKAKRQNVSEEESSLVDIISNLPDSVLSHILSFLPSTKESVRTSILSKRWRHVWTFVDRLKFKGLYPTVRGSLPRFVDRVLQVHQGNIKEFSLLLGHAHPFSEFDVISWTNTVISRGVERLHLDIGSPNWPPSIFSSKTLVDLKMWSLYRETMDIPTTPIFPCLKKLKVSFCDNNFLKRVVSRCPALEHLDVNLDENKIDMVSSSVKRLYLDCRSGDIGQKIVLCVPSLEYLKLFCALPFELVVKEQLSSLIEADIYFDGYLYHKNINAKQLRDSFVRFIQPFCNVKLLRIQSIRNRFFDSVGHGLFVNLTKSEIVSTFFEWRLLLCFMESAINLKAITLKKTFHVKKHKLAWKDPKKVPTSFSSSLKKISIDEYTEEELPMVTYVLRTAQVLEQVKIKCAICYGDKTDWKFDMLQTMQKLPRATERCEIFLV